MKYVALVFFSLFAMANASAQILPGPKLSDWAASYVRTMGGGDDVADKASTMAFLSYVTGVADGLQSSGKICIPEHTNGGQLASLVEDYIQRHADKWHDDALSLVSTPLTAAFKCAAKNSVSKPQRLRNK